jgi:PAS domain S-box-containing protein
MDDLTLSIGDLARRTGVDIPTLRRWERYEGLLAPTRTPGGQRRYGRADVEAVHEVVSLVEKGWPLGSAAKAVADHRDTGALVFDASLFDVVPAGLVVTNAANEVLYANRHIAAMLDTTPSELEGSVGLGYLEGDNLHRVAAEFEAMQRGEQRTYEVHLRSRAGNEVDVEVAAGPLLGPGGQYRGVVGVFRDIARTREAERRAALLDRLIDATDEALIAIDADRRVRVWNASAERAYGPSAADAVGSPLARLLPDDLAVPIEAAVERAIAGEPSTFELRGGAADKRLEVQVRVAPLQRGVRVEGAVIVTVDVAEDGDAHARVRASTAYHGVVATLTQSVLLGEPALTVVETAVLGIGRALEVEHVTFLIAGRPPGTLSVVASTSEKPGPTASPATPFGSHAAFAMQSQRPIVVEDFALERRFDRGPLAGEQGAKSGLCVPVRWGPEGLGVLSVHTAAARAFGPVEVTFVQSAANVCALALLAETDA